MDYNQNTNNSAVNHQNNSQVHMIPMEHQQLKEQQNPHMKPLQVIIHGEQRLVPYFLGGQQGYYTDMTASPNYDAIEFVIEFLALSVLVVTWVFFEIQLRKYQDMIPILYNAKGLVVQRGQKLILYIFPGLDTFLFVILTILQFITNRFTYYIPVTPENSQSIFRLARKLILISKLITLIYFVFLTFGTMSIINNTLNGYVLSYSVVLVILYGVVYYWYTMQQQSIADKNF